MIYLILLLALGLRLVNLNQSLWLDEAVQAITAQKSLTYIFQEIIGDFHPPLYHFLMHFWVRIFGSSEIALRMPSVLFGVGTVLVINELTNYGLRIKKMTKLRINGLLVAIFLATAPFHIYYSQEARMYSLVTFLATASMYFFIKIIHELTNYELRINGLYLGYFISTLCLIYSDYYGFLIVLAQIIGGLIIFRKNFNFYISKFLYIYLTIFLFYLPWLPFLITQFKTGLTATTSLPEWGNLVNSSFIKALPLTFVKFAIGRITVFDKRIYGLIVGFLGLGYGWLILRGIKRGKLFNCSSIQLLIGLWLIVPIFIAWLISLFIPNYQPFRLLLVLPAFYLLLSFGVSSINNKMIRNIIAGIIIGVNLISLGVYFFNPYFWREDWRGVASYIRKEKISMVISSDTFAWPLVYYGEEKNLIAVSKGISKIEERNKINLVTNLGQIKGQKLAYTPYLADLYDPGKKIPHWLAERGFVKIKEINFNQIPIWEYKLTD